jgi:hypothetical protein
MNDNGLPDAMKSTPGARSITGDRIIAVDGELVHTNAEIQRALRGHPIGESMTMQFVRAGAPQSASGPILVERNRTSVRGAPDRSRAGGCRKNSDADRRQRPEDDQRQRLMAASPAEPPTTFHPRVRPALS